MPALHAATVLRLFEDERKRFKIAEESISNTAWFEDVIYSQQVRSESHSSTPRRNSSVTINALHNPRDYGVCTLLPWWGNRRVWHNRCVSALVRRTCAWLNQLGEQFCSANRNGSWNPFGEKGPGKRAW